MYIAGFIHFLHISYCISCGLCSECYQEINGNGIGSIMKLSYHPALAQISLCVAMICLLASCNMDSDKNAKRAKAKSYTSADYVKHVALTQLDDDDKADIAAINSYAIQKSKSSSQGLLILEYKIADKSGRQKLAAPISLSKNASFPELLEIIKQLERKEYRLYNLRIARAKVAAGKSLKLPEKDGAAADAKLVLQEQQILGSAQTLAPREAINVELALIKFFIDHRSRDAAYITVDNAKQALAKLPHGEAETEALSKSLEQLEARLRETMPFTL